MTWIMETPRGREEGCLYRRQTCIGESWLVGKEGMNVEATGIGCTVSGPDWTLGPAQSSAPGWTLDSASTSALSSSPGSAQGWTPGLASSSALSFQGLDLEREKKKPGFQLFPLTMSTGVMTLSLCLIQGVHSHRQCLRWWPTYTLQDSGSPPRHRSGTSMLWPPSAPPLARPAAAPCPVTSL